jgi:hypothetical protein
MSDMWCCESFQVHNVAYLLKARTVESEKQPLLGNGFVTHNGVTVGRAVFCAVCVGGVYRGPAVITTVLGRQLEE